MGFHFSGIAISKKYDESNLSDLCFRFGLNRLEFREEVPYEKSLTINFEDTYLDILFLPESTLLFCSSPNIGDGCDIEKASFKEKTCFYCVDETSMTMMTSIYNNCEHICQYTEIHNEVKQSYLEKFKTNSQDGTNLAAEAIEYVTGQNFWQLDNIKLRRYYISNKKSEPSIEAVKFEQEYQSFINPKEKSDNHKKKRISDKPNNDKLKIFQTLISNDKDVVLKELERLNNIGFDKIILNYIMVVSLYHYDKDIRRISRKIFRTYGSVGLVGNIKSKWEAKFTKKQAINRNRLLEHNEINVGECMCMWQVMRRNYFDQYPATEYNLYLDGRGGVIGEVFNCFTKLLTELPDTFELLKHVTIVNLNKEPNLNVNQILTSLKSLPNLKTLKLDAIELTEFPEQIWDLKTLERLSLRENKFTSIPNNNSLPNLRSLEVVDCVLDLIDCKPFPKLEKIEIAKWTYERMDILNSPRRVQVTSGRMFSDFIEQGDYFGEYKDRKKKNFKKPNENDETNKPFWKFW